MMMNIQINVFIEFKFELGSIICLAILQLNIFILLPEAN